MEGNTEQKPERKKPRGRPRSEMSAMGKKGGRKKGTKVLQAPKQLKDMRLVYATEKAGGDHPDDTPGQAIARKLCRENPQQFLQLLNKLEEQFKEDQRELAKEQAAKKAGPSAESRELVDLIDRLLTDFEDGHGKR